MVLRVFRAMCAGPTPLLHFIIKGLQHPGILGTLGGRGGGVQALNSGSNITTAFKWC